MSTSTISCLPHLSVERTTILCFGALRFALPLYAFVVVNGVAHLTFFVDPEHTMVAKIDADSY